VRPHDDLGVPETVLHAQQGGGHVLVPRVPACLRPGRLAHALAVVLVRCNNHFAVLLRAQALPVRGPGVRTASPLEAALDGREHVGDVARDAAQVPMYHGVSVREAVLEAVEVG